MKKPRPISEVLAELVARRGYARVLTTDRYDQAWREAAGEALAAQSRIGQLRRGTLEVLVANSILAQELGYQKVTILQRLKQIVPEASITDLRCRVGRIN